MDVVNHAEQFSAQLSLDKLICEPTNALLEYAQKLGIEIETSKKQDLIAAIMKKIIANGDKVYITGMLDCLENYSMLRLAKEDYAPSQNDVYISNQTVKKLNLRSGDVIHGCIKLPDVNDKYCALQQVLTVNGHHPKSLSIRKNFDELVALHPNRKMKLELGNNTTEDIALRALDCVSPIGFGQRCLIVAPPKTGKTTILQNIAHAVSYNHPDAYLIVLLIDERPEEVTDMRRSVKGEVISSTFDEMPARHVHVTELALDKAKRLAENGIDVVILMDSLTRLARAYNAAMPSSGKILSGGLDANALHKPKRFLGAARNLEEGGSLTIIATALVETGSKMDEVIFEEFKGTGNSEIMLERKISDRRIFPAIDINRSSTRKEELLRDPQTLGRLWLLRRL